jgi:hypothetical protein
MNALRKLILGETWILPLGITAVVLVVALVVKPLLGEGWDRAGGFVLLAGVIAVLVLSVLSTGRSRSRPAAIDPDS